MAKTANPVLDAMPDDDVIAGFRYALTRLRVREDGSLAPVPPDAELDTLGDFIDAARRIADHDRPVDMRMALVGMLAADAAEVLRTGCYLWVGEEIGEWFVGAEGHHEAVRRMMLAQGRLLCESLATQAGRS